MHQISIHFKIKFRKHIPKPGSASSSRDFRSQPPRATDPGVSARPAGTVPGGRDRLPHPIFLKKGEKKYPKLQDYSSKPQEVEGKLIPSSVLLSRSLMG